MWLPPYSFYQTNNMILLKKKNLLTTISKTEKIAKIVELLKIYHCRFPFYLMRKITGIRRLKKNLENKIPFPVLSFPYIFPRYYALHTFTCYNITIHPNLSILDHHTGLLWKQIFTTHLIEILDDLLEKMRLLSPCYRIFIETIHFYLISLQNKVMVF